MKDMLVLIGVALVTVMVWNVPKYTGAYGNADSKNEEKAENIFEKAGGLPEDTPPEIMRPSNVATNADATFEANADKALATRVKQMLTAHPQLSKHMQYIQISVADKHVLLQGTVETEEDRENIVKQVEHMAEVKSVDNQLKIKKK